MFSLEFTLKAKWPKLAWVAILDHQKSSANVLHGPLVEVSEAWAVEGIWNSVFETGDFDKTNLVFGSGVRKRKNTIVFVSSATGVDRLWHVKSGDRYYVSNSLPGLLESSGLSLRDDYANYTKDIESVQAKGIYSCKKTIPSSKSDISLLYYKNLVWTGATLEEVDKPNSNPAFLNFADYDAFLKETAICLGGNARSSSRKFPIDMLVGLSTGYDSIATAVIAKYAGCVKAASIVNSSSIWRGSDSGKHIADLLGIKCQLYRHNPKKYRHEVAVWAGAGRSGGRNFSLFNYPGSLSVFFSGGYGDTLWDRNCQGVEEPKGGVSELLCEFRLIEGFFNCVVPWWGIQNAKDIQKINLLDEMKPWTLGSNYDRPIARRIIEEAGIPRGQFAQRKKDTSSNSPLLWPSTEIAAKSFGKFLQARGMTVPGRIQIKFISLLSKLLNLFYKNTAKRFGVRLWWRPWLSFCGRKHLFVWANHNIRDEYFK